MTYQQKQIKPSGFTIVELLIVIVIIAILAAITIVAYGSIQKRAGTVAYTSAADSLEKQIHLASVTNGLALTTGNYPSFCLSELSSLPANNIFTEGECRRIELSSGTVSSTYSDASFTINLKTNNIQLPSNLPETHSILDDGSRIHSRGFVIVLMPNGSYMLQWYPPDTSSCGRAFNLIEEAIKYGEANPEYEVDLIEYYGVDWKSKIRNLYGGAGYCSLIVINE